LTGSDAHLPFFAYGTLLPGEPNFALWREAIVAVIPATLPGALLFDLGHFPMLVASALGEVTGLVVFLERESYAGLVAMLDQVEGIGPGAPAPVGYRRERRIVRLANGQPHVAWVYAGDPDWVAGCVPLTLNWKEHVRNKFSVPVDWLRGEHNGLRGR
jgi:gamma-glutamylcyclotransferase (GGCT)/AIG2-like uncharacterized protein YtfP